MRRFPVLVYSVFFRASGQVLEASRVNRERVEGLFFAVIEQTTGMNRERAESILLRDGKIVHRDYEFRARYVREKRDLDAGATSC